MSSFPNCNSTKGLTYQQTFEIIQKLADKIGDHIKKEVGSYFDCQTFLFINNPKMNEVATFDRDMNVEFFYAVRVDHLWDPTAGLAPFLGITFFAKDINLYEIVLNDPQKFAVFTKKIYKDVEDWKEKQLSYKKEKEEKKVDNWKNGLDLL